MFRISITQLYVYPIKSVGGIALQEAHLDARGIEHDRRWMLVDKDHKFMSQRKYPRMALVLTRLTRDHLIVDAPKMPSLRLPLQPEKTANVKVQIWSDEVEASPVEREADEWFGEFLETPCKLVYMPDNTVRQVDEEYAEPGDHVGFADGFPFLLISQASLQDLSGRLKRNVPVNRFRPNIVVEGCGPFEEDTWRRLRTNGVGFRVAKPCSRCSIVMTDQSSGERDREVLATLAKYRKSGKNIFFGQNLAHDATGMLRVGDVVEVNQPER